MEVFAALGAETLFNSTETGHSLTLIECFAVAIIKALSFLFYSLESFPTAVHLRDRHPGQFKLFICHILKTPCWLIQFSA